MTDSAVRRRQRRRAKRSQIADLAQQIARLPRSIRARVVAQVQDTIAAYRGAR